MADSLLSQKKVIEGDHILESEMKTAIAILGFAIGKCVTSEIYQKVSKTMQRKVLHHLEFMIFAFVLVAALGILYIDHVRFATREYN